MSTVEMDPAGIEESAGEFDAAGTALEGHDAAGGLPGTVRSSAAEAITHLAQLDAQQRARSVVRCTDLASSLRTTARQAVHVDAMVR